MKAFDHLWREALLLESEAVWRCRWILSWAKKEELRGWARDEKTRAERHRELLLQSWKASEFSGAWLVVALWGAKGALLSLFSPFLAKAVGKGLSLRKEWVYTQLEGLAEEDASLRAPGTLAQRLRKEERDAAILINTLQGSWTFFAGQAHAKIIGGMLHFISRF